MINFFLKSLYYYNHYMISVSDLGELAGKRTEFHKLLVRCGFVLPSAKSEATALGWMYEVF
jgi:hypothetical protein